MKLKTAFLGALALSVFSLTTACSDDESSNSDNAGDGDGDGGSSGDGDDGDCPEHPLVTTLSSGVCAISGGTATEDLTLTVGNEYVLNGKLFIGNDSAETILEIEPGVTVFGGDKTFIVIQRGSKIEAVGTAAAPITFTSAQTDSPAPGDWGGLVLNGKGITGFGSDVAGEAETGQYGGDDNEDSSGTLKYVVVQYGGNQVDDANELNGIAFQGVGSGTEVDYVQVFASKDDGIEFFGGAVNVKHVVISNVGDDSIDWVGGWVGNAQFIAIQQWDGNGDRGIEADNFEDKQDQEPYSEPTLSNLTLWGSTNDNPESLGAMLRHGTKGHLHNVAIGNYTVGCLAIEDEETLANAASKDLSIDHSVIACDTSFVEDTSGSETEDWFNAGTENVEASDLKLEDPDNTSAPDLSPQSGSPLLGVGEAPSADFFESADYVGAFAEGDNWADGWTNYGN